MMKIKFGTDGWRAIIAKDYTVENVKRVAEATAVWLKKNGGSKVVIGHDCRFGGQLFVETTAGILGAHGIQIHMARDFVSTPMVSLGVVKTGSDLGIVITASHNPPDYNGYKLKSKLGGPMIPAEVAEVEAEIPERCATEPLELSALEEKGLLTYTDLEQLYVDHVEANFDMEAIRSYAGKIAYDAMYGAGMNAMRRLLPGASFLHAEYNPSFMGQAPEPIHRNLTELSSFIAEHEHIALGIANDGDADRIGMYDSSGNFVDSHHILLLLLLYQHRYRRMDGKVVITFSVTDKMKKMAALFGLPIEITPIGFKYIAEIMAREDVIVGGEESGGLAVKGHIPERDGIWIALIILEFMAKTGKSIEALIREVYDLVGPFAYDRDDVHLPEERKQAIIKECKTEPYEKFGPYRVDRVETTDGFKFIIGDDRWILIRPSGTEPVLRVYAQAPDLNECRKMLDATREELNI